MKLEQLEQLLDTPAVRTQVRSGFRGKCAISTMLHPTLHTPCIALALMEPTTITFSDNIVLDGESIPIILKRGDKTPTPLSND